MSKDQIAQLPTAVVRMCMQEIRASLIDRADISFLVQWIHGG
jgi:hypothetical protein